MAGGNSEEEAQLNLACTRAKTAFKAAPDDVQARASYEAAKAAFKAFQLEKLRQLKEAPPGEQPRKRKRAGAEDEASGSVKPGSTWTCAVCGVTISVAADGRAREQHLAGKNHKKKLLQAAARDPAAAAQGAAPASDTGVASDVIPTASTPRAPHGMFECKLCGGFTLSESARAKHVSGSRHRARLEVLRQLHPDLLKGDWVCCAKAHLPTHNYASKAFCHRVDCGGPKEQALSLDECTELVKGSKRLKRASAWRKDVEVTEEVRQMRCRVCKAGFPFTTEQQKTYAAKGLAEPNKCAQCRQAAKQAKVAKASKPLRPAKGHKPVPKALKRSKGAAAE